MEITIDISAEKEVREFFKEEIEKAEQNIANKILEKVEIYLIMPFEGTLITGSDETKEMHRKIVDYNRNKFNELKREFCFEKTEISKNDKSP